MDIDIDIDKIKVYISNINSILDHKLLNNIKFDELTKKISDRKLLNFYYNFFSIIFNNEFNEKNTKILLSSYVTFLFNKIVSTKKNSYNRIVFNISKKIFELHELVFIKNELTKESLEELKEKYNHYIIFFKKWIQKDKLIIIDDLIRIYFENVELQSKPHINPEYTNIVKEQAEKEKNSIIKKIEQIGGEKGLEYFEKQKKNIENIQSQYKQLIEAIEKNTKNAYWDIIKEKLSKMPPELDIVIDLVKEIQSMLCQCVPSRKDLHINIVQELDIDYMKHLIDNKVMDDREIIIRVSKILSWVDRFNSKEDKEFKKWKKDIEKELDSYSLEYNQFNIDISEFLPRILRYFLEKLSNIILLSEEFKQTEIYNAIKESKINEHDSD